jgi:hypothetical protein
MQNPNQLGRPPSYTYAPPNQLAGGQPQHPGRNSPMPPPPINTGAGQPVGYPPPQMYGQPGPPQGPPQGPPGYPPQGAYAPYPTAPPPAVPYRPAAAAAAVEVDGGAKNKAQLIVGIDFVSSSPPATIPR